MHDDLLRALLEDAPDDPERRQAWIRTLPAEARDLAFRWEAFNAALGARVSGALPETGRLIDHALGREADDGEREMARAIERVPALEHVLASMSRDAALFDQVWAESFAAQPTALVPSRDRAAARRDRPGRVSRIAVRVLTAAVVVAFAVVATLVAQRNAGWSVESADAQTRIVHLADGSTVRLHPGSTLRVADDMTDDRRVRLRGQAFFDIAPAPIPFSVETASALATVLGTRFAVRDDPDGTEVVLLTGQVAVHRIGHPGEQVLLAPGERILVRAEGPPDAAQTVDVTSAMEWTGLLVFRLAPMRIVAARVADRYGVRVVVEPALERETITGTFEPERGVDEVLSLLAETLGARLDQDPDGSYRLSARR